MEIQHKVTRCFPKRNKEGDAKMDAVESILTLIVLIAGLVGFLLFFTVLIKLDKALDIWLKNNKGEQGK